MLELLAFIALGIILGVITGLTPGLHVNAVSFFLLTLPFAGDIRLAAAIVSLAITHSLLDFIPSIFLGAPNQDNALSILPGHRMLLEGKALEALMLTSVGGIIGMMLLAVGLPLITVILPSAYTFLKNYIASILLGISTFMILEERKILPALFVAVVSGALGLLALKFEISLFACFSGFFGVSTLLFSMMSHSQTPPQTEYRVSVGVKESLVGSTLGFLSGLLLAMLPAMGSSQASVLAQRFVKGDDRKFLVSMGAISTVVTILSILTLYLIVRARSGVAVAVERIVGILTIEQVYLMIGVGLMSAGISVLLVTFIGSQFSRLLRKINYRKVSGSIIALLFFEVWFVGGVLGLLLLVTSTAIGFYCQVKGVRKSTCMNFLIVPTALLYITLISH